MNQIDDVLLHMMKDIALESIDLRKDIAEVSNSTRHLQEDMLKFTKQLSQFFLKAGYATRAESEVI